MIKEQLMVLAFTKVFNLFYVTEPTLPPENIATLRISLLREELGELKEAYEAKDLVAVADALGDLLYVTYGAALACGMEPKPMAIVSLLPVGKPRLSTGRRFREQYERLRMTVELLEKEFERACSFEASMSQTLRAIALNRTAAILELLVWVIYDAADLFCLDLEPIFAEIHRSNMSKQGGKIRADGKLEKPVGYSPPNLAPIIAAMG